MTVPHRPAKARCAFGGDALFPEGEDEVREEQLFQCGEGGVVERLSQVDSGDGCSQRTGHGERRT